MNSLLAAALILLALLGHTFWWTTGVNRLHGLSIGKRPTLALTLLAFALIPAVPLALAVRLTAAKVNPLDLAHWESLSRAVWAGLFFCWLGALVAIGGWLARRLGPRMPEAVRYYRRRRIEPIPGHLHGRHEHEHHAVMRLPGNEMLQLDLAEYGVELPVFRPRWKGFRSCISPTPTSPAGSTGATSASSSIWPTRWSPTWWPSRAT